VGLAGVAATVRGFAPSDLPGTSADASAASAAVKAAAPASIHLRVVEIRPSAASRSSAAIALSDRPRWSPGMVMMVPQDNQSAVRGT
jgi:hypothetical protein